ncbi:MAG: RNA polymerase sigma factor [Phycisphaerae bacterium]
MEARDVIRKSLAGLSRPQRLILLLAYCEGLTDAEIAAALDLEPGELSDLGLSARARIRADLAAAGFPVKQEDGNRNREDGTGNLEPGFQVPGSRFGGL